LKSYRHNRPVTGACFFPQVMLIICILSSEINAQDTVSLKAVDILSGKLEWSSYGKKVQELDSSLLSLYRYKSVSDVLTENSTVFIKNYGPGSLSSTALRGGSAYHTALLWNGFNIQNPMLGQSDLSTLPAFIFDKMTVEYGGSSALWGSGAVGGTVKLENNSSFHTGTSSCINFGTNSFGAANVSLGAVFSKKSWILSTKLYNSSSRNTYTFKNDTGALQTQQYAPYSFRGLLQELKFKITGRQLFTVNAWISSNQRRIPPSDQSVPSKTWQADKTMRLSAAWNYNGARLQSFFRTAAFTEQFNYTDSLISLFSKSQSTTIIAEQENFFQLHPQHRLHLGLNYTGSSARADNYDGQKQMQRFSLLVGENSSFFNRRLQTGISLRAEYLSAGSLPITGNVFAQYQLIPDLKLRINAGKIYRQPTLNELYWQPGGNPSLRPEQGYTFEGGADYQKHFQNFIFTLSGSAFSRQIQDWVLWVPGPNTISSPSNIQSVWSRGTECDLELKFMRSEFGWQIRLHTSYVLSTVLSTDQENSSSEGKQLIYTPRYMGSAKAMIWYEATSLSYFYQYTGYRFTSSDNSQWLDPYHLSSLKLNYTIKQNSWQMVTFVACNNLFNVNYSVMAGRPMPLRNYEIGITLLNQYKKAKTNLEPGL
jgi:vitamin B12 transporter